MNDFSLVCEQCLRREKNDNATRVKKGGRVIGKLAKKGEGQKRKEKYSMAGGGVLRQCIGKRLQQGRSRIRP